MNIGTIITGVASDHGWSKTPSVPLVDALSVETSAKGVWPMAKGRGRRRREGGVKVEGEMPGIGFFTSMVHQ